MSMKLFVTELLFKLFNQVFLFNLSLTAPNIGCCFFYFFRSNISKMRFGRKFSTIYSRLLSPYVNLKNPPPLSN